MADFKKIIVATDFSESSLEALREADSMAHETDAELVVFHSLPNIVRANPLFPQQNIEDAFELPKRMERAAEALEKMIDEHLHKDCTKATVLVDTGPPDATLLRAAEQIEADLIVLGSRGFTGLRHVLLGSVAERVVRYAHCAVLIARTSAEHGHILAATDFSDPSLPAIDMASRIARRRNVDLTVMHSLGACAPIALAASPFGGGPIVPDRVAIEEARIAATELLQTSLKRFNAKGSIFVGEGIPDDDILRQAARLPAGLIVVGSLGRTGIRRVALGSVAETIARKAACSVLVVRLMEGS